MSKKRIFLSYSHNDSQWCDHSSDNCFVPWLEEALDDEAIFWYDPELRHEPGEWRARIEAEIDRADAAILLISQNFMKSRFIRDVELPRIQERAQTNQMTVIPIMVGPVIWEDLPSFITDRQVLPGDKPTPLSQFTLSLPDFEQVRVDILRAIRQRLDRSNGVGRQEKGDVDTTQVSSMVENNEDQHTWQPRGMVVAPIGCLIVATLLVIGAIVSSITELRDGPENIHDAANQGDVEALRVFLDKGTDIEERRLNVTPLFTAAFRDQTETAALLIDRGADIEARCPYGWTPLHWCAFLDHEDTATLLLSAGADANVTTTCAEELTPLHMAVGRGNEKVALTLIVYGANPGLLE